MTGDRRSILIDARVNGLAGAHGLVRSVVRLAENLATLSRRADLIDTNITLGAVHRPNGVDPRPFAGISAGAVAAARERYELPDRYILAVGAHRPHKNYGLGSSADHGA